MYADGFLGACPTYEISFWFCSEGYTRAEDSYLVLTHYRQPLRSTRGERQ